MADAQHEGLVTLFRNQPRLVVDLLQDALHIEIPPHRSIRLDRADFPQLATAHYAADAVIVFDDVNPVLATIVEVQRTRDPDKPFVWPLYVAAERARLRCNILLVVVCPDASVAAWCRSPIALGNPDSWLVPTVIGPAEIPVIIDENEAQRAPELAVLSAIAHASDDETTAIQTGITAITAVTRLDDDKAKLYADMVFAAAVGAVRTELERMMASGNYEYQSEFFKRLVAQGRVEGMAEGRVEGKAEGLADALLEMLAARSIDVSEDVRARIRACTDVATLNHWIRKALTIRSAGELFEQG